MNIWISQIIATVFLEALGTLRKEYNKLHVLCTFDIWWQTKNKKKKKQPRNRHPVRTGFKILVMLQDSAINLPWQNNIKDKKHDAPSSTGSNPISGVHHSFIPLPKKNLLADNFLFVTVCNYRIRTVSQQNTNKNIFIQILFTAVNLMERLFRHEEYMSNSLHGNFNSRSLDKGLHNTAAGRHSATQQPLCCMERVH